MTRLSTPEATEILTGLGEVKAGLTTLTGEVHLQGEVLARLVQLLTPSDEQSGSRLRELLAALIGRLDRQAVMLKEILEAQRNLCRTLPSDVAQAINQAGETGGPNANEATGSKVNGGVGQAESQP